MFALSPSHKVECFTAIRMNRNDAVQKVTGIAKYTDDLKFYGMLHAIPVYTNYVHARIENIDVSEAQKCDGVVCILTHRDVFGELCYGQIKRDYSIFAHDKIRYNGDVIALVVAKTRGQAIFASKKVHVDVTELEPILDPQIALVNEKNLVHESNESNIINHHCIRRGKENAIEDEKEILEYEFRTQYIEHAYLEPESAVCNPRSDGVMEIYGSMQHPFSTRRFVASLLGVSLSEVEVLGVSIGGGFGGKDDTAAIVCARTALASKITGKPVKTTYEREWSIRESYKRHPYIMRYRVGFNESDGKIQTVDCKMIADGGAYASVTPFVTWRSTVQCCGPYSVPNVHCDVYGVYTNNVFTGAMRGFGSPQVNFAIEQIVDIIADRVGISPLEYRMKYLIGQGEETVTGQLLDNHIVSTRQVLENVSNAIEFEKKFNRCSYGNSDSDELYGIGIACSYRGMSLGAEGKDICSAIINIQQDGTVLLEVGVHENGQGAETVMINILAEELGISTDKIRYQRNSTSHIPDGCTTVASRGTLMGGGAVVHASRNLKKKMKKYIPESMNLTWEESIKYMFSVKKYPYAFGEFSSPDTSWNEENGKGNAYFTWVYGCQSVEILVNKKTGKIKILNIVASHDIGKAINRQMLLGQIYGGITQGVGYATIENLIQKDGKIHSTNFNTYRIPRSTDIPDINAIIVENNDPNSPSKAKGIGEPSLELMAPAIANAFYRATGNRCMKLPISI